MAEAVTEKKGVRWFYKSMNYCRTTGVDFSGPSQILWHVKDLGYCSVRPLRCSPYSYIFILPRFRF